MPLNNSCIIISEIQTTRKRGTMKLKSKNLIAILACLANSSLSGSNDNKLPATQKEFEVKKSETDANIDELFWIKQISDFIEEKNYSIAKSQLKKFFQKYPNSPFIDNALTIMGDLELKEGNLLKALSIYEEVTNEELSIKNFNKQMYCMEKLGKNEELINFCENINLKTPEIKYYLALGIYNLYKEKAPPRTKKALEILENENDLNHKSSILLAKLYILNKKIPKAIEIYKALAEHTSNDNYKLQAAVLELDIAPQKAKKSFLELSKNNETKKEASFYYLLSLFTTKDYKTITEVGKSFIKEIDQDKQSDIFFIISQSYYFLSDFKNADLYFMKIKKLDSKTIRLGIKLKLLLKDEKSALNLLTEMKKRFNSPAIADAYEDMAHFYTQNNEPEKAKEYLIKVLSIFPNNENALHNISIILFSLKNYKEADSYLKSYLKISKQASSEILSLLPQLAFHLNNDLDILTKKLYEILHMPNLPEKTHQTTSLILANTFMKKQQFEKALGVLKEIKSDDPQVLCHIGHCYYALKDWANATNYLKKSKDPTYKVLLFNSLLLQKKYDEAATVLVEMILDKEDVSDVNTDWYIEHAFKKFTQNQISKVEKDQLRDVLTFNKRKTLRKNWQLISLYRDENNLEKAVQLRDSLLATDLKKSYGKQISLELAKIYYNKGKYLKAIDIMKPSAKELSLVDSRYVAELYYYFCKSVLQLSEKEQAPYEELTTILLKMLYLQKNYAFEPLHMKAALLYANYLYSEDNEKRKKFLIKAKNHFLADNDVLSKDYILSKNRSPELFDKYMIIFDKEIESCDNEKKAKNTAL